MHCKPIEATVSEDQVSLVRHQCHRKPVERNLFRSNVEVVTELKVVHWYELQFITMLTAILHWYTHRKQQKW